MSANCPLCGEDMEWTNTREAAPNHVNESFFRCVNPECDCVSVAMIGVDV